MPAGAAAPLKEMDSGAELILEDSMNVKNLAAAVNIGLRDASVGEQDVCQGDNPLENLTARQKDP